MKKYLLFIILLFGLILFENTFAAMSWGTSSGTTSAINNITSGVKSSSYQLIWCPSQKNQISGLVNDCKTQQFSDEGSIATLLINGDINIPSILTDNMAFKIIGEGKLTIQTFISDNANNIAKKEYVYLVDKTAPKIGDIVFTESSPYIYAEETENVSTDLNKSQAVNIYTEAIPLLDKYIDQANIKNKSAFQDIQKVRYKNIVGQILKITLNNTNDDYGQLSTEISGLDKIEYLDGVSIIKTDPTPTDGINLDSTDFGNNSDNGKNINVRLYDKAGNYSEKAFYVFRDETVPVASSFNFQFIDNQGLKQTGTLNSKFILANTDTKIKYDWGLTNNHMAAGIKMKTENINSQMLTQESTLTSSSGTTNGYNLSIVKGDLVNTPSEKNYRKYSIEFETPGILGNKICDAVGNCINGTTVLKNLRVIAGKIDEAKSILSITQPTNGKAIANNPNNPLVSKYSIGYSLEDRFDNTIRQVISNGSQIKDVKSDFIFTNGLTKKFTPIDITDNGNSTAVKINNLEGTSSINHSSTPKLTLKEDNSSSDGYFQFTLSSKVPTYGGYKYMKDSAILSLDSINNDIVYEGPSLVYNGVESNPQIDFIGTEWLTINSMIEEDQNDRFNLKTNLSNYGELTGNYSKNLVNNTNTLNFEFGSPFIYTAQNFNILRDGTNSNHIKNVKDNGSGINTYKLTERYFDVSNIFTNTRVDFYVNNILKNNFIGPNTSFTGISKVKYDAKEGQDFDKWGYVSYLSYNTAPGEFTYIPSISRGIQSASGSASAYYPNVVSGTGTNFLTKDVSISGLVNNIDGSVTNDIQPGQVSLDMERPYTRAELLQKVKKKVFTLSRGLDWCNNTDFDMNNPDPKCTINIQGEEISFYKGDIVIPGGNVSGRRSIIVKDGRVTIAGDINTKVTNGQLLIVSVTDKGLSDIAITTENDKNLKQKGWITIKQNVTNIDAFLLSQGPLVSSNTSDNNIFKSFDISDRLLNQLHIYGSVFSLNTIGGSKVGKCPYIEKNCSDGDTSKVYDLSFLRRYTLVDAGNFGGDAGKIVPYDPDLDFSTQTNTQSKSSGGLQYKADGTTSGTTVLRTAKIEHKSAPVIIERDNRWASNPSIFAKD